jgi:hypothetical protein
MWPAEIVEFVERGGMDDLPKFAAPSSLATYPLDRVADRLAELSLKIYRNMLPPGPGATDADRALYDAAKKDEVDNRLAHSLSFVYTNLLLEAEAAFDKEVKRQTKSAESKQKEEGRNTNTLDGVTYETQALFRQAQKEKREREALGLLQKAERGLPALTADERRRVTVVGGRIPPSRSMTDDRLDTIATGIITGSSDLLRAKLPFPHSRLIRAAHDVRHMANMRAAQRAYDALRDSPMGPHGITSHEVAFLEQMASDVYRVFSVNGDAKRLVSLSRVTRDDIKRVRDLFPTGHPTHDEIAHFTDNGCLSRSDAEMLVGRARKIHTTLRRVPYYSHKYEALKKSNARVVFEPFELCSDVFVRMPVITRPDSVSNIRDLVRLLPQGAVVASGTGEKRAPPIAAQKHEYKYVAPRRLVDGTLVSGGYVDLPVDARRFARADNEDAEGEGNTFSKAHTVRYVTGVEVDDLTGLRLLRSFERIAGFRWDPLVQYRSGWGGLIVPDDESDSTVSTGVAGMRTMPVNTRRVFDCSYVPVVLDWDDLDIAPHHLEAARPHHSDFPDAGSVDPVVFLVGSIREVDIPTDPDEQSKRGVRYRNAVDMWNHFVKHATRDEQDAVRRKVSKKAFPIFDFHSWRELKKELNRPPEERSKRSKRAEEDKIVADRRDAWDAIVSVYLVRHSDAVDMHIDAIARRVRPIAVLDAMMRDLRAAEGTMPADSDLAQSVAILKQAADVVWEDAKKAGSWQHKHTSSSHQQAAMTRRHGDFIARANQMYPALKILPDDPAKRGTPMTIEKWKSTYGYRGSGGAGLALDVKYRRVIQQIREYSVALGYVGMLQQMTTGLVSDMEEHGGGGAELAVLQGCLAAVSARFDDVVVTTSPQPYYHLHRMLSAYESMLDAHTILSDAISTPYVTSGGTHRFRMSNEELTGVLQVIAASSYFSPDALRPVERDALIAMNAVADMDDDAVARGDARRILSDRILPYLGILQTMTSDQRSRWTERFNPATSMFDVEVAPLYDVLHRRGLDIDAFDGAVKNQVLYGVGVDRAVVSSAAPSPLFFMNLFQISPAVAAEVYSDMSLALGKRDAKRKDLLDTLVAAAKDVGGAPEEVAGPLPADEEAEGTVAVAADVPVERRMKPEPIVEPIGEMDPFFDFGQNDGNEDDGDDDGNTRMRKRGRGDDVAFSKV